MLRTVPEVEAAAGHDPLVSWVAQGMRPGVRAWAAGDAVAVACPNLSRRDRLAVRGGVRDTVRLLGEVLPLLGPGFRPLGDERLITAVTDVMAGLDLDGRFGWMDTTRAAVSPPERSPDRTPGPCWLDDSAKSEIGALLDEAFPTSYARPGGDGVRRWAGLRDRAGALLAVAADAWSAPTVALLAGVATRPGARGRGHAASVCAFMVRELLPDHERVALFVDDWNVPAIAMYRRLGFVLRPVAAAQVT